MKNTLLRIVSVLLIPYLFTDPILAAVVQAHATEVVGQDPPDHYQSISAVGIPKLTDADFQPGSAGLAFSAEIRGDRLIPNDRSIESQPPHGGFASSPIKRRPGSLPVFYIDSCQPITSSGIYFLTADLNFSSTPACLSTYGASNITIDCQGHSILLNRSGQYGGGDVDIANTPNFTLQNCSVSGPVEINDSDNFKLINDHVGKVDVANSQNGQVTGHNQITQALNLTDCANTTVTGNTFTEAPAPRYANLYLVGCSNTSVTGNKFIEGAAASDYAIESDNGNSNTFENNQINGGWDGDPGTYKKVGLDDGLMLSYENADRVIGNTIQNCYDTGIETIGTINGLDISQNTMHTTGVAALGAYHNSDWNHVNIENNAATDTPSFYIGDFEPNKAWGPIPNPPQFSNVSIRGNSLTSPRLPIPQPIVSAWNMALYVNFPSGSIVGNNVLTDNHFDVSIPGPYLNPPEGFTDGGGNVWGGQPSGASVSSMAQFLRVRSKFAAHLQQIHLPRTIPPIPNL